MKKYIDKLNLIKKIAEKRNNIVGKASIELQIKNFKKIAFVNDF